MGRHVPSRTDPARRQLGQGSRVPAQLTRGFWSRFRARRQISSRQRDTPHAPGIIKNGVVREIFVNHRFIGLGMSFLLCACGGGGGGGSGNPPPPPADTTAPDTTIVTAPAAATNSGTATFTFTSNETVTYQINLNGAGFTPATNPHVIAGLLSGAYTVEVRARDAAGNTDLTPATHAWTVDLVAPDTTITAGPPAVTASTAASFTFSANETATFEARLDGAAFTAVTSPHALTGLAAGAHTFEVRARDVAGNLEPTPATHSWTVSLTAPQAAIVFPTPVSYTDASTITVRGVASGAAPLQGVTVNGVAATSATAFSTWSAVIPVVTGNNAVTVSVTDSLGLTNPTAATATIANRGPPLLQSGGTDYDPTSDSLVVVDVEANVVLGFRVSDGIGRVISRDAQAADPDDTILSDLVVDAPNNRALAIDWAADAVVAIDLTTGARTTLSSGNGTGATSLTIGNGIAYDAANGRVFVTAYQTPANTHAIIAVNLANGSRTVVSTGSGTVGAGPTFTHPGAIVYDATSSRLLVAASTTGGNGILQVNVANGDRVLFSQSPGTGTGPAIPFPSGFHLASPTGPLYVSDASINPALFRVNLATGDRELIAGPGAGSGAALSLLGGGLAVKPSTGQLFAPLRNGEVQAIDPVSLVRSVVVDPRVGSGTDIDRPATVRAEQSNGPLTSLLFAEPESQRLMRLNLATGVSSIVSGGGVGTGSGLNRFVDFVLDVRAPTNGTAALALLSSPGPGKALISIDLATGNRLPIADLSTSIQPRNLQLDVAANRVLFTNIDFSGPTHGLYAVNLATSAITTVSSNNGVGSGTAFTGPAHLLLDPEVNPTRALIVDINPSSFIQVNLANGARSPFIPVSGNPSTPLIGPIYFDRANNEIYGLNLYPAHLYVSRIAVGGGETSRAFLSGTNPSNNLTRGTGPAVDFGTGLVVDTTRSVAFVGESNMGAIMAIDLVSGDRVIIAR
jgi:hypothetical protein